MTYEWLLAGRSSRETSPAPRALAPIHPLEHSDQHSILCSIDSRHPSGSAWILLALAGLSHSKQHHHD